MLRRVDIICPDCGATKIDQMLDSSEPYPNCDGCGTTTEWLPNTGASVIGDEFPGGIWIKHGAVNPDGSPRKFYSKTEIKRVLNEKGLKWSDDTPGKAYKVSWSGRLEGVKKQ